MYAITKNKFPEFNYAYDCSACIPPDSNNKKLSCWQSYQPSDKGVLYLSISGEYRIEVKFCPFCGYSPDKNKELIEKFRPTLEKLSKE